MPCSFRAARGREVEFIDETVADQGCAFASGLSRSGGNGSAKFLRNEPNFLANEAAA